MLGLPDDVVVLGMLGLVGAGYISPTVLGLARQVEALSLVVLFNALPMG